MTLPASFAKDGFMAADKMRGRLRRLMLGTDGWSNTGKTEFAMSAPGPGIGLILDRSLDPVLDNPHPPKTRNPSFAFKTIVCPKATQFKDARDYGTYWYEFYDWFKKALDNPDCRTIFIDTDSDSWELQRMAAYGKITGVLPTSYTDVNAARKVMYNRAYDSGKIVIGINKLADEYEEKKDGEPVQKKTGNVRRQGFRDQDYLWHLQIRHLFQEARVNPVTKKEVSQQWGLRILKCKANSELQGTELWGADCNFQTLVSLVYPQVAPEEWGY